MEMNIGRNAINASDVRWSPSELANPHVGLFGDTGMGKSHLLRRFAHSMLETGHPRFRMHIIDPHGDLEIEGESSVNFNESAPFGFNPLELNPDLKFGGVRKRIQSLIGALNRTAARLGHRQERALTKLLVDLYAERGFLLHDAATWAQDPGTGRIYPSLVDAIVFAKDRLKTMYLGSDRKAMQAFEEVSRAIKQRRLKQAALARSADEAEQNRLEREIGTLAERAVDAYREALAACDSGEELDDLIESDGKLETMKSIVDRLENLYAIGIYKSTPPPLDPRCRIWRYVIDSLDLDEKKLFVMTRLETIFTRAIQRGMVDEVIDVIVLDEAHLFLDKDEEHIINRIAREGRKFGLAIFFASQSPTDFPDVVLSSLATKITLGLDPNYWSAALRKLGLTEKNQEFIIPRRRIVVQMKQVGQASVGAYHVILP
jgi:DNA helicase HerA-like ATPase